MFLYCGRFWCLVLLCILMKVCILVLFGSMFSQWVMVGSVVLLLISMQVLQLLVIMNELCGLLIISVLLGCVCLVYGLVMFWLCSMKLMVSLLVLWFYQCGVQLCDGEGFLLVGQLWFLVVSIGNIILFVVLGKNSLMWLLVLGELKLVRLLLFSMMWCMCGVIFLVCSMVSLWKCIFRCRCVLLCLVMGIFVKVLCGGVWCRGDLVGFSLVGLLKWVGFCYWLYC